MSKTAAAIRQILETNPTTRFSELLGVIEASPGTVKKHLNSILKDRPELLERLTGFYPEAKFLVDAAERKLGEKISSNNLSDANIVTKVMIEEIAKPELDFFLREGIGNYLSGDTVTIPLSELSKFIATDLDTYTAESGNGSISIVGRLNEEIFIRALENSAVTSGNFRRTGNNSIADIVVEGKDLRLYIEVKSYHARERLLRGLQDINHPEKVGVGFFQDHREFNKKRTQTLIDTGAWAIYLPEATYEKIDAAAKAMTTAKQSKFYRPLGMFVHDMEYFVSNDKITDFV